MLATTWTFTGLAQTGEPFISSIQLDSITFRDGVLFWKTDCGAASFPLSRLQRKPSGGGVITTMYLPGTCQTTRVFSKQVAVNPGYDVFWATGEGTIARLPSSATTGTAPQTVTSMESASVHPPAMSASENYVFWTETSGEFLEFGKIFRVWQGGPIREIVRDLSSYGAGGIALFAVNNTRLFFLLSNGRLVRSDAAFMTIPAPGYWAWFDTTISTRALAMAAGNGRMYYAARAVDGISIEIRSVALDSGTSSILHHTISGTGGPYVLDLAVDGVNLYWHEVRSGVGPVMRKPLAGGAAAAITDNLFDSPNFLVSDGHYLFWKHLATEIRRLPVNAAALTYDLAATGLEVIQVIQRTNNDVPLVMNKPTFVRLYGRILTNNAGATQVSGWPMAQLVGKVGGVPLPGSPLSPLGDGAPDYLYLRDHYRPNLAEGYLFHLPLSWTLQGAVTLRGEINPAHIIHEANYANNTVSVTPNFARKSPVCAIVYPLRTMQGIIGSYHRFYQPYLDLAEMLLPTSRLRLYWPGGSPIEEYEFPFSSGPYEMSQDDNDSGSVLMKLWWRALFGDDPDECDDLNAKTHRIAFFRPFANQALNGVASVNDVFLTQMALTGSGINNPIGAVTFSHEAGHNYGRDHVNCPIGDPADPDPGYPYGCNISSGPTSYLGFNPLARKLILDTDAGDLLSYAHRLNPPKPRWPSDYTWRAIFNAVGTVPAGLSPLLRPAAREGGGGPVGLGDSNPPSVVMGNFTLFEQVELMNAAPLLDAKALARATTAFNQPGDNNTFMFRALDSNNALVRTIPVKRFSLHDGAGDVLMALLDEDPQVVRLDLVKPIAPNKTLASLTGGGSSPTVAILTPAGGEIFSNSLAATWTGFDPEGNQLHFSVRYSRDNGTSWAVLVEDTIATNLNISTTGLPGGVNTCRLEVIASDGLLSATALSAAFTVKPKPPQADIFFESERGRNSEARTLYAGPGEEVTVRGQAYDDEDGPLAGPSLNWSIAGPAPLNATGDEVPLRDLPPGTYLIKLLAIDSSGLAGTDQATLIVDPKYVPNASTPPVLDGYPEDAAYFNDHYPLNLRYLTGELGFVRTVQSGGSLYISISGMPIGTNPAEWVGIVLDPDHSNDPLPQTKDLRLIVFADGRIASEHGNGSAFATDSTPTGFSARVVRNDNSWSAEIRVDPTILGGWNGQTIGMDVAHYHRRFSGDDTHWLTGAGWNVPSTWADVVLAPNPEDPFDSDNDGMADDWEWKYFKTLARDGDGDYDGDGQSDRDESIAGTHPVSNTSHFKISTVEHLGPDVVIRWPTVTGRAYRIWRSTDLQNWWPVQTDINGTGGEMSSQFPTSESATFYRLDVRLSR